MLGMWPITGIISLEKVILNIYVFVCIFGPQQAVIRDYFCIYVQESLMVVLRAPSVVPRIRTKFCHRQANTLLSYYVSIPFIFYFGHTQQFSVLPDSVLKEKSWIPGWDRQRDHMGCLISNLSWLHDNQMPYLLYLFHTQIPIS